MQTPFPPMPADLRAMDAYWTVLHPNWLAVLSDEQRARHAADPELAAAYEASILRQLNEARAAHRERNGGGACWSGMTTPVDVPHGPRTFEAIAARLDGERAQMAVAA